MSTMDSHTDAEFNKAHADARAGLTKAELAAKSASGFEGRKVEVQAAGSKRSLDSSEAFTSQTKKK